MEPPRRPSLFLFFKVWKKTQGSSLHQLFGPGRKQQGPEGSRAASCLVQGEGGLGAPGSVHTLSLPPGQPVPAPTHQTPGCSLGSDPGKGWRQHPNTSLGHSSDCPSHSSPWGLLPRSDAPLLHRNQPEGGPIPKHHWLPSRLCGAQNEVGEDPQACLCGIATSTKVGSHTSWVARALPVYLRMWVREKHGQMGRQVCTLPGRAVALAPLKGAAGVRPSPSLREQPDRGELAGGKDRKGPPLLPCPVGASRPHPVHSPWGEHPQSPLLSPDSSTFKCGRAT